MIRIILYVFLLFSFFSFPSYAEGRKERRVQKQAEEIRQLKGEIKRLKDQLQYQIDMLNNARAEIMAEQIQTRNIHLSQRPIHLGYLKRDGELYFEQVVLTRGAESPKSSSVSFLISYKDSKKKWVVTKKTIDLNFKKARKLKEGEKESFIITLAQQKIEGKSILISAVYTDEQGNPLSDSDYTIDTKAPSSYEDIDGTLRSVGGRIKRTLKNRSHTLFFVFNSNAS